MRRRFRKPEGHSLYWGYVYALDNGKQVYSFDTSSNLKDAEALLADNIEGYRSQGLELDCAHIFFGDADGAFTHFDPAVSRYFK